VKTLYSLLNKNKNIGLFRSFCNESSSSRCTALCHMVVNKGLGLIIKYFFSSVLRLFFAHSYIFLNISKLQHTDAMCQAVIHYILFLIIF